ncbi:MAG: L-threonylcarbamoyladenylate synthase [Cytophagaceae bacterium]
MSIIGTDINKAQQTLEQGNLVAIPTETVYGLAANGLVPEAVAKIFAAKNRPTFDPLILHTYSIEEVKKYVTSIPSALETLAKQFWPGPLTLLLEKKDVVPDLVTSGLPTVAFRIPNHSLTLSLLQKLSFPIAAPSANPFGYISPTTAQHVENQLGEQVQYILDGGACKVGVESTIVGMEDNKVVIYRLGGLSIEAIEAVIGKVEVKSHSSSNPKAPGMLESHYAPRKPMLLGDIPEMIKTFQTKKLGILSFQKSYSENYPSYVLSSTGNTLEAASNLFAYMRLLDNLEIDIILAEELPEAQLGRAINDRLRRAAATTHS